MQKLSFTVDQIGNGAKSLLDEVATGKVTGEEEIWSHTDLCDFQANVDGARVAFEGLQPVLQQKDPALAKQIAAAVRRAAEAARPLQAGRPASSATTQLSPAAGQAALRRRQRALRAAVAG